MKRRIATLGLLTLLALSIMSLKKASQNSQQSPTSNKPEEVTLTSDKNVIDILKIAFPTFYEHIKNAGFTAALEGTTSITIFAPTEKAFEDLKQDIGSETYDNIFNLNDGPEGFQKLQQIITLHFTPKLLTSPDFKDADVISSVGEKKLALKKEDGVIKIHDTGTNVGTIVQADIIGKNGVVHAIDAVILP